MVAIKYITKFFTILFHRFLIKFYIRKHNPGNNRVLVQVNSGIGDCICALPMIRELALANFDVYALVNDVTENIVKLCPDIKGYFVISNFNIKNLFQILKKITALWKLRFNYYIGASPSNVIRCIFLPVVLRIPNRIKHHSPHKEYYQNYDFLFNKLERINYNQHIAIANMRLLKLIDEKLGNCKVKYDDNIRIPSITLSSVQSKLMQLKYIKGKKTIGIHPGCKATWSFKRWPAEKFGDLINRLTQNEKIQVILLGGYEDISIGNEVIISANFKPINFINKLTLEETIGAIRFCDIFVSNDSGLMHIATLLNIPVIGIFGGKSNEVLTGPLGEGHIVIKKNNIEDITVSEVMGAVMEKIGLKN